MHGDKRQEERERILRDFKRGLTAILVATDVASRGIGNRYSQGTLLVSFSKINF